MKKCGQCGETFPISQFTPDKRREDGFTYNCKKCRALNMRMKRHGTYELKRKSFPSNGFVKTCSKCLNEKPISEFNKNKIAPDGLSSWCRECSNEGSRIWQKRNKEHCKYIARLANLKRKFNITQEEYERLYKIQEGKCAICGSQNGNKGGIKLSVDHDHTTGKIRGLLCGSCNTGIGLFKEKQEFIERALQYLRS